VQNSGTTNILYGAAFGAGQFVAVGANGTLLTSARSAAWQKREAGTNTLFGAGFGGGKFVAVGEKGKVLSSPDGVTWTPRTSGVSVDLGRLTYGAGQFVAVGVSGSIVTSSDGDNWTVRRSNTQANLFGVAYGNGRFLAVGDFCDGFGITRSRILTSQDGEAWSVADDARTRNLQSVSFGNDSFVVAANTTLLFCLPLVGGPFFISRDGVSFDSISVGTVSTLFDITYGNGAFVAAGLNPNGGAVLYSLDGGNWITHMPTKNSLLGIAFGDGKFVAVGASGTILQSGLIVRLADAKLETNGKLSVAVSGRALQVYTIETSDDLMVWRTLENVTSTGPELHYQTPNLASERRQFYRIKLP
jgi:hypothetical protein